MSRPVSVAEARARAAKLVQRDRRDWAAQPELAALARLELPLHPPKERDVLADTQAAIAWAQSWREVARSGESAARDASVQVSWSLRNWASVGRQEVPERLSIAGADAIAHFAGREVSRDWRTLRDRASGLSAAFGDAVSLREAIRRHGTVLGKHSDADMELLTQVLRWLVDHPVSGYRLRQVPVPGMHTKWLAAHRTIVEALHTGITGRESLGLIAAPATARLRFLDPQLRPGGLDDVTVPLEELAALNHQPAAVLILENLETLLALPDWPDWPGVIALHGAGYAVAEIVPCLPWVRASSILYWGDLDTDGFAILHALRSRGIAAASVLMDEATYEAFRELWVEDPGFRGARELPSLEAHEQRAYERLAIENGMRLEQERIPWHYALEKLRERLP